MEFEFNWELNLIPDLNFIIGYKTVNTDTQLLKNFLKVVKIIYVKLNNYE